MQRTKPKRGGPAPTKQAGKTKRNRKRRQRQRKQIGLEVHAGGLSPCAQAYMRALSLPFGEFNEPPCIPDTITIPSSKFSTTVRGTMVVGTQGVGYVAFNPFQMAWNDGAPTNSAQSAPIRYTTIAYTGIDYTYSVSGTSPTTGTQYANSTSPYNTLFWVNNTASVRQFRLVGAGLRILYVGTELNRGGKCIMLRDRANQNIQSGQSSSFLLRDQAAHFSAVDRNWREVTYVPSTASFISYQDAGEYDPTASGAFGDRACLLAYVEGVPGAQSFAFEAIAHFEAVGPNMPVTPSMSDPVGYGAVSSAIPQTIKDFGSSMYRSMEQGAYNALAYGTSAALTGASAALAFRGTRRQRLNLPV